ncbi:NUDIX hydrolase [Gryllotalpicola protaetiae]|uniref:NUDIX hydrolase n=1 Tax=Gryllotalpicola protaetiae TaxID=2419771 RepID=A0A387BFQ8_9MICO|nr:NUDIX domain-containing protein [Gryllotalpicola protaetiae]AYG02855.1 NUDIX hydrolase [Gryllotalpicola protaetiae]
MTDGVVLAAGAVCWRIVDGDVRVLVIHRPRYDDLTLPKGKVDPGETLPQTAVREVREETGLTVTLGVPLSQTRYTIASGREKVVHYWTAEVTDAAVRASRFRPNSEVDAAHWMPLSKAKVALSYEHDIRLLEEFATLHERAGGSSFGVIVLRHAKALGRSEWGGVDEKRPLAARGVLQAQRIVPTVRAWSPRRILTSPAVRCASTVAPLARALDRKPRYEPGVSQDAWDDGLSTVPEVVAKRIVSGRTAVLCSHRPVLPDILREFALATGTPMTWQLREAAVLEPAAFTIVHLSVLHPTAGILAVETHSPL